MEDKIQKIIILIQKSTLDQTIKDILIRDLKAEGLTDFLREQIIAYCTKEIQKLNQQEEDAMRILLEKHPDIKNPAA